MTLNLEQLQTFRAIVRSGTFSRAADELFLTQPAISQRMSHLEQALGLELFHRDGGRRTLRLTAAGEQVLRFTDDVIARTKQLHLDLMNSGEPGTSETLTIASGPMFTKHIVLHLVTAYCSRYPNVRVKLIDLERDQIGEAIRLGEAELGVVVERYLSGHFQVTPPFSAELPGSANRKETSAPDGSFLFIPLIRDQVVLVAAPGHPAALDTKLWLASTKVCSFVSPRRNSQLRLLAEQWAISLRLHLDEVVETASLDFLKQAVMRGLGVALVSHTAVADEVQDGRLKLLSVPGLPQERQFCLVSNGRRANSAAVRSFIDIAQEGIWRCSLPGHE